VPSTEELLDRLDNQWRKGIIPNLEELLRDLNDSEHEGRAELCAADLEWRWRTRKHGRPIAMTQGTATQPARPSAQDYQSLLGDAWQLPACQQRVIDAEWLARSAWGDKPHIDRFLGEYQLPESRTESLGQQLEQVVQMKLTVEQHSQIQLEISAPQDIILGRQNTWEPAFPAWIPAEQRLVVADVHQRNMSRKQLRLRRVRAEEIELTNVSGGGAIQVDRFALAPGQTMNAFVPFIFTINDLKLSVITTSN
jgi:hypothetical protein